MQKPRVIVNEPFLFTGMALYNNSKKFKVFWFWDGDKRIMSRAVSPNWCIMNLKHPFGIIGFDVPIKIEKDLRIEAGRKWTAVIEKNGNEYIKV